MTFHPFTHILRNVVEKSSLRYFVLIASISSSFFLYLQVRDEIEQLMDDDGDMAEMYLTEKKRRMESTFYGDQCLLGFRSSDGISLSAPVSPVSSPPDSRRLEKSLSITRSRHESMRSSASATESVEELEMLLEAYFVVIDSTLNKLTSVCTISLVF